MFNLVDMLLVKVGVEGGYTRDVFQAIGDLGLAHMVDSRVFSDEEDYRVCVGRYIKLLSRLQTLLEFVRMHCSDDPRLCDLGSRIGFDEEIFSSLPFDGRLAYLSEAVEGLEGLMGIKFAEIRPLLRKESVLILDKRVLDFFESRGLSHEWIGYSSFLYVVSGLLDASRIDDLERRVFDITGENHVILREDLPGSNKVLATVVTLVDLGRDLERFIAMVPCRAFFYEELSSDYLQGIRDMMVRELHLLVGVKNSTGRAAPLLHGGSKSSFRAWVPARDFERFRETIMEASCKTASVEVEKQADEEAPALLDNPSFIKPFESILEMYSLPRYKEIDPTPFLALTLVLFFGFMFGDLGHGLLVVLAAIIFYFFSKKEKDREKAYMALLCGFASVFFGLMYGGVFGFQHVIEPMWRRPEFDLFFVLLVILAGISHMSFGLSLDVVNKVFVEKRRGILLFLSLISPISQLSLFAGIVLIALAVYLGLPDSILIYLTVLSVLIPTLLISVKESVASMLKGRRLSLVDDVMLGLVEAVHILTSTLSNTVSYLRLLILLLVHEISGEIVILLSGMLYSIPWIGVFAAALFFFIGTVLILLEGFIFFIQDTRLHYYEFFSRFYSGGGLRFTPFRLQ